MSQRIDEQVLFAPLCAITAGLAKKPCSLWLTFNPKLGLNDEFLASLFLNMNPLPLTAAFRQDIDFRQVYLNSIKFKISALIATK